MKRSKFLKSKINRCLLAASIIVSANLHGQSTADRLNLPDLGSSQSSILSEADARTLADTWIRMFRAQVPTIEDPLLHDYTYSHLYDLASYSQLNNPHLQVVLVRSTALNAFAVPGGVIGVNAGLFMLAETEGQFSSVLTHELAHLSQHHFERRVEHQQEQILPMIGLLLGAIAIAASGSDAAAAAIVGSQAAMEQSSLNYSRSAEQEADRIGIQTLAAAGYDPREQTRMFEIMKRQVSTYGDRYPEYLRTHPFSERRSADAALRAGQYPLLPEYRQSTYYQYMRARAAYLASNNPSTLMGQFDRAIRANDDTSAAGHYGKALVYAWQNELNNALEELEKIPLTTESYLVLELGKAEVYRQAEDYESSASILEALRTKYRNNLAIDYMYAQNLFNLGQHSQALTVLNDITMYHQDSAQVWFLLAEVNGLAGNLVGVHKARAEWYALNGAFSLSEHQLNLAIRRMELEGYHMIEVSRTRERRRQISNLQLRAEQL